QNGGSSFGRLCAEAHRAGLLCAPSVGPGYDAARATGDLRVKPRRDGLTYDAMWISALRANPDLVTITSYNEWSEGTQIEPAKPEPAAGAYLSYDGAWGRHGRAASRAYLWRTACWAAVLAGRAQSGFHLPRTCRPVGSDGRAGNPRVLMAASRATPLAAEDADGKERGVACVVDADARHRHAGRHLDDREQGVEAVEHALRRAQRHTDHGQVRMGRGHAGQGGGEARARDQHPQPACARAAAVLRDGVRSPVGR